MFITILMMFLDIVVRISSLSIPRVCPAISEDAAPRIPSAMSMGPGVLSIVARVPGSMFGDHGFWCVSQVYSFRKGVGVSVNARYVIATPSTPQVFARAEERIASDKAPIAALFRSLSLFILERLLLMRTPGIAVRLRMLRTAQCSGKPLPRRARKLLEDIPTQSAGGVSRRLDKPRA